MSNQSPNFGSLLSGLAGFFTPVVSLALGLFSIVSFCLGALADPKGLANSLICGAIDLVAAVLPSTPESLTINGLITSAAGVMPAFGVGIVREIAATMGSLVAIALVIKIYKLIPFKAT